MKRPFSPLDVLIVCVLTASGAAQAETVGVTGQPLYITRSDCQALVRHHPSPDVAYQPGVDVNGKYVAPADLPDDNAIRLPDTVQFDLKLDPLRYSQSQLAASGRYDNTAINVGRVAVDLKSGAATLNGRPLSQDDGNVVVQACRKAGFR